MPSLAGGALTVGPHRSGGRQSVQRQAEQVLGPQRVPAVPRGRHRVAPAQFGLDGPVPDAGEPGPSPCHTASAGAATTSSFEIFGSDARSSRMLGRYATAPRCRSRRTTPAAVASPRSASASLGCSTARLLDCSASICSCGSSGSTTSSSTAPALVRSGPGRGWRRRLWDARSAGTSSRSSTTERPELRAEVPGRDGVS